MKNNSKFNRLIKYIGFILVSSLSFNLWSATATLYCNVSDSLSIFAAREIKTSFAEKGYTIANPVDLSGLAGGSENIRIVLSKKGTSNVEAALSGEQGTALVTLQSQGYSLRKTTSGARTTYWVIGADKIGVMYGGIDIAETIKINTLSSLSNYDRTPYLSHRGIKYNWPLDVRTPSYSGAGEPEWNNVETVWDFNFWKEFLDDLARYHYDLVSLWNMHPFPSIVKVPGYENVALNDVKKTTVPFSADLTGTGMTPSNVLSSAATIKTMTIDEKIAFWKKVMEYGRDRGISFYIITWNIFTYGTNNQYGITEDQANATTKDYTRKSVKSLLLTYPLLAGIGITAGEHMSGVNNEQWLYDVYAKGVQDAKADIAWQTGRTIRFIHRTHQTDPATIISVFNGYTDSLDFSFKYSLAHMYSSSNPTMIDSWIGGIPSGRKTWLTLRNDDYYMTRWGDPEYARAYLKNMPVSTGKVIGFYMGPDGYNWGREFISTEPESPRQTVINKMWYMFKIWGDLAYYSDKPSSMFNKYLGYRFPQVNGSDLFDGWATVSKILPLVTRFHWVTNELDYQWYPEACSKYSNSFQSITEFINDAPIGPNMMSIPTYRDKITGGLAMGSDTTPVQVAQYLKTYAAQGLQSVENMNPGSDKELRLTLGDIRAMAYLGNYYAEKILGATDKAIYAKNNTTYSAYKATAISHLQLAAAHWRNYASAISAQYVPQRLTRIGPNPVDLKKYMPSVLADIALAGGTAASGSVNATAGGRIVEAEIATQQGGAVASATAGFTGTGYLNVNANGKIDWTYSATAAGRYLVEFRYSINSGDVTARLGVNGTTVDQTLSFWTTGSSWQVESRYVNLNAGTNTISLILGAAGVSIDHMNVVLLFVPTLPIAEKITTPNSLSIRNGALFANISLEAPSTLAFAIFDIKGRMIKQFTSPLKEAGAASVNVDIGNVPRGFYIVKLTYNGRDLIRKISLDR